MLSPRTGLRVRPACSHSARLVLCASATLLGAALGLAPRSSAAADAHVTPGTGPDGVGTEADPFHSIQACADVIGDGETCWVGGGDYAPTRPIGLWSGGSAGAPRRLAARPGETPIIDGRAVEDPYGRSVVVIGSPHWIVQGLEITGSITAGIQGWGASHAQVLDNVVHDCQGAGIALWWNGERSASVDNLIRGNHVYDCALDNAAHSGTSWPGGIAVQLTEGTRLEGNRVERVHGEGILSYLSDSVVFVGNVVESTYSTCYYLDNTTRSVVERNYCRQGADPRFFDPAPPNGIRPHNGVQTANETYDQSNPSADNIVRNNVIVGALHGFYYGSYQRGGGLVRVEVVNNLFWGSVSASMHVDADSHSGARFANNVFVPAAGAAQLTSSSSLAGVTFERNFWSVEPPNALIGAGDVLGDPLLTSPGTDDALGYRPLPSSPLVDAGLDLGTLVPDDFEGLSRSAPYDLGPFELGGIATGGAGGSAGTSAGEGSAGLAGEVGDGAAGSGAVGGTGAGGPGSGGAGSPGAGARAAGDAGATGSGAASTADGSDGGCSCRTRRAPRSSHWIEASVLAALGILGHRRRRRRTDELA